MVGTLKIALSFRDRRPCLAALVLLLSVALAPAVDARVIRTGEGDRGELPNGFSAVHKIGEQSTGSTQAFVAVGTIPPGMSTGRHLHEVDEEILYVLEGELTVVVGDETLTAGAGDTVFVPAATWMELANRSEAPARALLVIPRAEAERCFRVVHGIDSDLGESERAEVMAICKIRFASPPAAAEE